MKRREERMCCVCISCPVSGWACKKDPCEFADALHCAGVVFRKNEGGVTEFAPPRLLSVRRQKGRKEGGRTVRGVRFRLF